MTPKSIWKSPQKMPDSDIVMSTVDRLPPEAAHAPLTRPAVMTVMGPVGPLICDGVPPNKAAKKPSSVAPTRPANAPILAADGSLMPPKAWMPNAKASGKATIPAVIPPVMSPLRFFVEMKFILLKLFCIKV